MHVWLAAAVRMRFAGLVLVSADLDNDYDDVLGVAPGEIGSGKQFRR
jgi:hypothetical protein